MQAINIDNKNYVLDFFTSLIIFDTFITKLQGSSLLSCLRSVRFQTCPRLNHFCRRLVFNHLKTGQPKYLVFKCFRFFWRVRFRIPIFFAVNFFFEIKLKLTIFRIDLNASQVRGVIVEGDVPLSPLGPAVIHHDVVLRSSDQKVWRIGLGTRVVVPGFETSSKWQGSFLGSGESIHGEPGVDLKWNVKSNDSTSIAQHYM